MLYCIVTSRHRKLLATNYSTDQHLDLLVDLQFFSFLCARKEKCITHTQQPCLIYVPLRWQDVSATLEVSAALRSSSAPMYAAEVVLISCASSSRTSKTFFSSHGSFGRRRNPLPPSSPPSADSLPSFLLGRGRASLLIRLTPACTG